MEGATHTMTLFIWSSLNYCMCIFVFFFFYNKSRHHLRFRRLGGLPGGCQIFDECIWTSTFIYTKKYECSKVEPAGETLGLLRPSRTVYTKRSHSLGCSSELQCARLKKIVSPYNIHRHGPQCNVPVQYIVWCMWYYRVERHVYTMMYVRPF